MPIQGQSRDQGTLFPERLDELIGDDNPVRVIDAFVDALDSAGLSAQPATDPDARVMKGGRIGYNVQSTVDSKHRLISDVDVVQDGNDLQQLYRMARRSQRLLNSPRLEVLADAGYSNGKLLKRCQAHGLTPWVPVQRAINNQGTGSYFDKTAFAYNAADDSYTCPAGERLPKKTQATKDRHYLYTTDRCGDCNLKLQCTAAKQRWVTRHFDEDVLNEVAFGFLHGLSWAGLFLCLKDLFNTAEPPWKAVKHCVQGAADDRWKLIRPHSDSSNAAICPCGQNPAGLTCQHAPGDYDLQFGQQLW